MKTENLALDEAFKCLATYDRGSARGDLVPIDEAVISALKDSAARKALERQLSQALAAGGSVVAKEYVCSKLVLVGTDASVPALAGLLEHSELSTAARTALEAIPGSRVSRGLRKALQNTNGLARVGVINSLANRRDRDAVKPLARLLNHPDAQVAGAAASALARIGSAGAADCLARGFPNCPVWLRARFTDALLECAERLRASGETKAADKIQGLLKPSL